MKRKTIRAPRGTSLIEAMIAMTVMLIGMAGFASLQVISVRANHFSKRISMASALATDLTENVNRMAYSAPLLTAPTSITTCGYQSLQGCLSDTTLMSRWDMGRSFTPAYTADYSDGSVSGTWQGFPVVTGGSPSFTGVDIDRDSRPDFARYWNVYEFRPPDSDFPAGKFVQVIVRWKEPGFGYRQVTNTAFKFNPAAVVQ